MSWDDRSLTRIYKPAKHQRLSVLQTFLAPWCAHTRSILGLWELNAKKLPPRNLFDLLKSLLRRLVRNIEFAKTFFKIAYDFGVCWRDIFHKFWKYSTTRTHLKTKEWFYQTNKLFSLHLKFQVLNNSCFFWWYSYFRLLL